MCYVYPVPYTYIFLRLSLFYVIFFRVSFFHILLYRFSFQYFFFCTPYSQNYFVFHFYKVTFVVTFSVGIGINV